MSSRLEDANGLLSSHQAVSGSEDIRGWMDVQAVQDGRALVNITVRSIGAPGCAPAVLWPELAWGGRESSGEAVTITFIYPQHSSVCCRDTSIESIRIAIIPPRACVHVKLNLFCNASVSWCIPELEIESAKLAANLFKPTEVLMATPQGRRLWYHTPEQVSNPEPTSGFSTLRTNHYATRRGGAFAFGAHAETVAGPGGLSP